MSVKHERGHDTLKRGTWTRRLLRASWARRSLILVLAAVALPLMSYVTLAAFTLSKQDVQARDFGRFDARVDLAIAILPGESDLRRVESLEGPDRAVELVSLDVRSTADPDETLVYREADWEQHPFPRIDLSSGRWPTSPGEVVVSPGVRGLSDGGLSVLSDQVVFEVVGVAQSGYEQMPMVLAAPGTWASFPASAARARQGLTATPIVLADEEVAFDVASTAGSEGGSSVLQRSQAEAENFWVTESPFAFYVPALLLPCLAGVFGFLVSAPRRRRLVDTAAGVGMQARDARVLAMMPLIVMAAIGVVAGLVLGTALGFVGRKLVATQVPYVSSMPSLLVPCLVLSGSLLAGIVAGVLTSLRPDDPSADSWRLRRPPDNVTRHSPVRYAATLLLGCVTAFALFRVDDGQSAMIFGACLLTTTVLLLPDVLRGVSRRIPERGPRLRLARRLILEGGREQAVATGIACVVLALPLSTAILLTANGVLDRSNQLAGVGPGQLAVQGRGGIGTQAPKAIRSLVDDELGGSTSTALSFSEELWYDVAEGNALVAIVDAPEDVANVWGEPLTDEQTQTLRSGGLLTWQPGAQLLVGDGYVDVAVAFYRATPEWESQTGAIMLKSSAEEIGIQPHIGAQVFTDVSATEALSVKASVVAAGLDPGAIETYKAPVPLVPPLPLVISAILLFATLVSALLIANRVQARSLRQRFSALIAIGAGPNFARRIFTTVQLVTLLIAVISATAVTVTTCLILILRAPTVELFIPWMAILGGALACAFALWLSTRLALRGLSGHEAEMRRSPRRRLQVDS